MSRIVCLLALLGITLTFGCSDGSGSTVASGQTLYSQPHEDALTTFACATCHALEEPAPDGLRRPGHPIGDAANRPSFKNGQLDALLDAVNTCRVEWMAAPELAADDPRWIALSDFLAESAGTDAAPELSYQIVPPPSELEGGDPMEGQTLFNQTCVVCHGIDARGTNRGPALSSATLDPSTIAIRVRTSGDVESSVYDGLSGGRMPFWAADRLSDDELRDLIAFVLATDVDGGGGGGGANGNLRECDATHPRIGQVAELQTFAHQVSGTAVIVDDCTVRVDDFVFDGGGIDVRFYGGVAGNYEDGYSMSEQDLRRPGGYDGTEPVYAQLPDGRTLDDLDGISVWCVPVAASFGDGLFRDP